MANQKMSDQAWLAIATNERLPAHWGKIRQGNDGLIEEASAETMAMDFRSMTQRHPERFASLALRLSPSTKPTFLGAILSGLAWPGDQNGRLEEGWVPPSHKVLEEVLALPTVQELARGHELEMARNLCRILERYPEHPWSEGALDLLIWVAQHHRDPEPGVYPVGSTQEDSAGFDRLEANALNVTRGTAGFAIRSLLFQQPATFSRLRPAIESLVRDEHPAVRVAALAACLPVVKIDRPLAVDWYLQAGEGPDSILATREAADIFRHMYRTHLDRLRPLIERMIASPQPRAATAGAVQAAASFLVMGQMEEEFKRCLGGTPAQRKGIAQVAASLLQEPEFAEGAKATLLRMSDDEDKEVGRAVAHSFRQLNLLHIESDREAWNRFARSKAFQAEPLYLLHALSRQEGKLLPFADCLLAVGDTFAEELADAAKDFSTRISGDVHELFPLLLRLYEQVQREDRQLYLRCLDLWDRLLERRVGAAMGLTRELDRF